MIENRLTKLETKLDIAEVKIHDMHSLRDAIIRLVAIQESQEERNKGQEERNKKFDAIYEEQIKTNVQVNATLGCINTNLNLMNEEMKCTSNKADALEEKLDEKLINTQKESDENDQKLMDRLHEINDKSKVDILDMLRKIFPSLALSGVTLWVLHLTGVINF